MFKVSSLVIIFLFLINKSYAYDNTHNLIAKLEGCTQKAYTDIAGVKTIGCGNTTLPKLGIKKITINHAHKLLSLDINTIYRPEVLRASKKMNITLKEYQLTALTSLNYNIGFTQLYKSGLLHLLRNKPSVQNTVAIKNKWLSFSCVKGEFKDSLYNRRQLEFLVFLGRDYMTMQKRIYYPRNSNNRCEYKKKFMKCGNALQNRLDYLSCKAKDN